MEGIRGPERKHSVVDKKTVGMGVPSAAPERLLLVVLLPHFQETGPCREFFPVDAVQ